MISQEIYVHKMKTLATYKSAATVGVKAEAVEAAVEVVVAVVVVIPIQACHFHL
jgi:hypothetical protein